MSNIMKIIIFANIFNLTTNMVIKRNEGAIKSK